MYPRNAASPEPIAIGAVVQISDGAVQTSGVTVRIKPVGVAEGNGAGTTAYSTDGVVLYTPTQSETNYTSFVLIASKAGCFPASQTVITSESTTSGRVYVATNGDKTGYSLSTAGVTGVTDGIWNALDANYTLAGSFGAKLIRSTNSNNQVSLTGGPTPHIAADVHAFQAGVITTAAFAVGAITSGVIATDAIGSDELAASGVTKIQLGLGLASANLDTQLAGIQSDTNDIQSRLPAALIAGRMDSNVQAIAAGVVTQIQSGLSTLTAAQVNAEVLDVLQTDLFGELAAVPGASSSLKDKIAFLFMLARNKVTQTSSTQTLFADNTTTPVAAASTSDVGGTFTRGEFA